MYKNKILDKFTLQNLEMNQFFPSCPLFCLPLSLTHSLCHTLLVFFLSVFMCAEFKVFFGFQQSCFKDGAET